MASASSFQRQQLIDSEPEVMNTATTFGNGTPLAKRSVTSIHLNGDVSSESGFTLIEAAIALVILMIALLGVAWTISYSINYNAGNSNRAKTLAVLQQEVERLRSAKFTPTFTDNVLLGCKAVNPCSTSTITSGSLSFIITKTVDNDPSTTAIDDETDLASSATSFKEIRLSANLANPSPGWQTAVPAEVVLRRVKSN
jgi:type II secretory pathway pseudopilin PulG